MNVQAWGATDVGLKRSINQDSFLIDHDLGLFVVADGMGGHKGGEVASAIAVQTAQEIIKQESKSSLPPRVLIQKLFVVATSRIHAHAKKESSLKGMGTTMVLALLVDDNLYVGNVGDSRCYLIDGPEIWALTEDHSLIHEQLRAGILNTESAKRFEGRNIITRSVGYEENVECDVIVRKIRPGDSFILCSDGLHGLVSDDRICDVCLSLPSSDWTDRLIEEAKTAGGDDNISVVVIHTTD